MILLRCPKFLRCLTADAGNFDRGHSLTSLPLPLAALGSLPTGALRPRNDIFIYTLHTLHTLHTLYIPLLCKHPLHQEQQAEARQAQDADEKGVEPV